MSNDSQPAAVVTDASERLALHVVRALGRKAVPVHAVEIEGRSPKPLGFLSRYTTTAHIISSWEVSAEQWLSELLAVGERGDVLIPCCLNTLLRVLECSDALGEKFRFLLPPEEKLRCANDKWELYGLARALGIPVPVTYRPEDLQEAREVAEAIEYPAMVKFRHDEDLYLAPEARREKANSPAELLQTWQRFHALQPNPAIQQFVLGTGYGFEALYDQNAQPVSCFAHRRLIEYPPSGGPSAVCESVHDDRLAQLGQALLDALSWRGVAMAEFRRSADDGEFYLLEVNPRFWGSLPLAEAAGVNFPYLLYQAALGQHVSPVDYKAGLRMRLLPTYLLSVYRSFRSRPWALRHWLPRLAYLLDPRVREGLVCLDDLRPAFAYFRQRARGA